MGTLFTVYIPASRSVLQPITDSPLYTSWANFTYAVVQLVETLRYKPGGRGFDGVVGNFHGHNTSGPGVDSTSSRNEYQEYVQGVKAAGARADLTTIKCRMSRNLGASTFWNP
jgi:hypothetical protein